MKRNLAPSWFLLLLIAMSITSLAISPRQVTDAITLLGFWTETNEMDITLRWDTASEYDVFAFYLQRSLQENGTYVDISTEIPPQGDDLTGAQYFYPDYDIEPGTRYYYKLRVVYLDNSEYSYGPIWGQLGLVTDTPGTDSTSTNTATHTQTTQDHTSTPTATSSLTPSATNTQSGPTATRTKTSTIRPPTSTRSPTLYPRVSFTPKPSDTFTPEATSTETATEAPTGTPTTTLLPLPSITIIFPSEEASPTTTAKVYTTATKITTTTPNPEGFRPVSVRASFLLAVVGILWLLLGGFLFTYIRRLGQ